MANMREIRTRMKSIQDTMKITNAMYLISSSKLKQARKKLEKTLPYFEALSSTMADIMQHLPETENIIYINNNGKDTFADRKKRRLYIIVTADKGLAGAYNHNIFKVSEEYLSKGDDNTLFLIGQMGRNYFRKNNRIVDVQFHYTAQNPSIYRARDITESVIELYVNNHIDEVYIIYNKMINSTTAEPDVLKILPFERSDFEYGENEYMEFDTFTPSPAAVFNNIAPNYVKGIIYSALVEAFSSEQNARMTAMEAATTSAKDMLKNLSLMYNRARQAAITQEITEIVSGANSLNNKNI
ncbi:MAG: ATP synthase F1 subunit gamma [Clostridia bacterium]|nr:ATP synthase F1 subunit gamma [Clostridia bacterium]